MRLMKVVTTSSMTNHPLEISSFYSHLSMMPNLLHPPTPTVSKLPPNLYRPNSWMDPTMQPYFYYNLALNDPNQKRKNATRETTATLKAWLYEHRKNPYPTKNEKMVLAMVTKMTLTQVSTWFANARRRLKKENKLHRTTTNSKSEEEEDDDEEEEEDLSCPEDDDDEQNENEQRTSHVENDEEQTIPQQTNLKRKRDDQDEIEEKSNESPAKNRPKIWSIVDVVQSSEPKRNSSSSTSQQIIHPCITSSIPFLFYPPPTATVSNSSPSDQSSSLSPISSSSTSSCSPTK